MRTSAPAPRMPGNRVSVLTWHFKACSAVLIASLRYVTVHSVIDKKRWTDADSCEYSVSRNVARRHVLWLWLVRLRKRYRSRPTGNEFRSREYPVMSASLVITMAGPRRMTMTSSLRHDMILFTEYMTLLLQLVDKFVSTRCHVYEPTWHLYE